MSEENKAWYLIFLGWLVGVWVAIKGFFKHIWDAAKTAAFGVWNNDAMGIKFAAAFLVALAFVVYESFATGFTVVGFILGLGMATSTITVGLVGVHLLALFAYRLFKPAGGDEKKSPFPFEHEKKATWARENTRVVA